MQGPRGTLHSSFSLQLNWIFASASYLQVFQLPPPQRATVFSNLLKLENRDIGERKVEKGTSMRALQIIDGWGKVQERL